MQARGSPRRLNLREVNEPLEPRVGMGEGAPGEKGASNVLRLDNEVAQQRPRDVAVDRPDRGRGGTSGTRETGSARY
jgi:hypothetical protein